MNQFPGYSKQGIGTGAKLGIAFVIAVIFAVTLPFLLGGDMIYDTSIEGKVSSAEQNIQLGNTDTKTKNKFGVILEPVNVLDNDVRFLKQVADDVLAVDCNSTRCAGLKEGAWVKFDCRNNYRFFEPNVIECKLVSAMSKAPRWAPSPVIKQSDKVIPRKRRQPEKNFRIKPGAFGEPPNKQGQQPAQVFHMDTMNFGGE